MDLPEYIAGEDFVKFSQDPKAEDSFALIISEADYDTLSERSDAEPQSYWIYTADPSVPASSVIVSIEERQDYLESEMHSDWKAYFVTKEGVSDGDNLLVSFAKEEDFSVADDTEDLFVNKIVPSSNPEIIPDQFKDPHLRDMWDSFSKGIDAFFNWINKQQ